jgi:hypothetical protein
MPRAVVLRESVFTFRSLGLVAFIPLVIIEDLQREGACAELGTDPEVSLVHIP